MSQPCESPALISDLSLLTISPAILPVCEYPIFSSFHKYSCYFSGEEHSQNHGIYFSNVSSASAPLFSFVHSHVLRTIRNLLWKCLPVSLFLFLFSQPASSLLFHYCPTFLAIIICAENSFWHLSEACPFPDAFKLAFEQYLTTGMQQQVESTLWNLRNRLPEKDFRDSLIQALVKRLRMLISGSCSNC
jgi:hypothetical protein